MRYFTRGELAKAAQVHSETVRYYERRGLLPPPSRRPSGYRQYTQEDVARLRFIKRAQELGFSLREIAELLALRVTPETACEDVRQRAERKIAAIEAKMQTLQRMKETLYRLVAACHSQKTTGECPILETLDRGERYAHRKSRSDSQNTGRSA